jgi:type IV pilus modification protein PilV
MNTFSFAPSHRQRGFSLLEVLIAVLVFSVGLMGLAGLQIVGMKANQNALLRSIASEAAYDMLDQLRAQTRGTTNVVAWNAMLADLLPSGQGAVCISASANTPAASCWSGANVTDPAANALGGGDPSKVFLHVKVEWTQAAVEDATNNPTFVVAPEQAQQVIVTGQL